MKPISKRLNKLEAVASDENMMNGLGEYYAWEKTPEGIAELDKLYDENRYDESEQ